MEASKKLSGCIMEAKNEQQRKDMFVFELDRDNAIINPLKTPPVMGTKGRPSRRTVTKINGSFVYQLPLTAMGLSLCFLFATVLGIILAKRNANVEILCGESGQTGHIDSFVSSCTLLEVIFLVINFAVGHYVVLRFRTSQRTSGNKRRFVALAVFMIVTLAIVEISRPYPKEALATSTPSGVKRNDCKLYTQGFSDSVDQELFLLMNQSCPGIANSGAFHMLDPDISALGVSLEANLRSAESAMLILSRFFAPEFPISSLTCQASFPMCTPVNCTAMPRCNVLKYNKYHPQYDWYNVSYERRKFIYQSDMEEKDLYDMIENIPKLVADEAIARLHYTFNKNIVDEMLGPVQKEWKSLANSSTCHVGGGDSILIGPCHRDFNITSLSPKTTCTANFAELKLWVSTRIAACFIAVVALCSFLVVLAKRGNVEYYSVSRDTDNTIKVMTAQMSIFLSVLFVSTLTVYGGTLLESHNEMISFQSLVYYTLATGVFYSYGVIIKPTDDFGQNTWENMPCADVLKQKISNVMSHKCTLYCLDCLNPHNPKYVYRVLLFEAVEIGLQIGALVSPQLLNGDIVLVSVVVIFINTFATATLLQCFTTSPSRVAMLITVELICDGYFMLNGILRLQSNTNLSFLEHLALLKPVATFNMDLYDLYRILQIDKYETESSTSRLSVLKAPTRKCRMSDFAARWDRILLLWLCPVLLLVFAIITSIRYGNVVAECTERVGDVAFCASERYYFNAEGGILGTPSCNFQAVTSLQCADSDVRYIANDAGLYFPTVKSIQLKNNPGLRQLPSSFTQGNLIALESIDISYTMVVNFPYELATSRKLKEIRVTASPVSSALSWHNRGIKSMDLSQAFVEAFQSSLGNVNLSSNNMTEFPHQLCRFTALATIDVSQNNIDSLHDYRGQCNALEDFEQLRIIIARGNRIVELELGRHSSCVVPGRFLKVVAESNPLRELRFSEMSNAMITRECAKSIITPPYTFTKLTFHASKFINTSKFLPWPASLKGLKMLVASGSSLAGELHPFVALTALEHFNAYGSYLEGTLQPIRSLVKLTFLSLGANMLSGPLDGVENLTNLKELRLYRNKLSGSLGVLNALQKHLYYVSLQQNQLSGSLGGVSKLVNLRFLQIGKNRLTGSLQPLHGLHRLTDVRLEQNNLKGPISYLANLDNMAYLRLADNFLNGTVDALKHCKNLVYLNLRNNKFTGSLYNVTKLPNLTALFTAGNQFSNGSQ
jgi:Leucine-rich repeat (LRR) protein